MGQMAAAASWMRIPLNSPESAHQIWPFAVVLKVGVGLGVSVGDGVDVGVSVGVGVAMAAGIVVGVPAAEPHPPNAAKATLKVTMASATRPLGVMTEASAAARAAQGSADAPHIADRLLRTASSDYLDEGR
jgi:hypothetical protein